MSALKPCERCGADKPFLVYSHGYFVVECRFCGKRKIYGETQEKAIKAWNR